MVGTNYGLDFTEGQKRAIEMALKLKSLRKSRPLVGVLKGCAGTGKTTVIREISSLIGGVSPALAPTGKASQRITEATGIVGLTLHRWMYDVVKDEKTGNMSFVLRPPEDIQRPPSGVIVVDEASMLDRPLFDSLYKTAGELNCNILLVGDPFQLMPVTDEDSDEDFNVLDDSFPSDFRVELTEVLRQAAESPVIRASMAIREGRADIGLSYLRRIWPFERHLHMADIVNDEKAILLCYRNITRRQLNSEVRAAKGYTKALHSGEPVLVMKNCYELNRFNGEVIKFSHWNWGEKTPVKVVDRFSKLEAETRIGEADFRGEKALLSVESLRNSLIGISYDTLKNGSRAVALERGYKPKDIPPFLLSNYGYALTCHKAQGSEWDKVFVYLERRTDITSEEGLRWLYTAVTRAKHQVTFYVE